MEQFTFEYLEKIAAICQGAGNLILDFYYRDAPVTVEEKSDETPVTEADHAAHEFIVRELEKVSSFPVLSEEGQIPSFEERRSWQTYWLVDPLDGTREFLDRSGDFTVNIALICENRVRVGLIYAPDKKMLYMGGQQLGAFKKQDNESWQALRPQLVGKRAQQGQAVRVLSSRRHGFDQLWETLFHIEDCFGGKKLMHVGSSLKFCLIADGQADCYVRYGPTSEWDTAAGQAILESVGGQVLDHKGKAFTYNSRPSLLNGDFWAVSDADARWLDLIDALNKSAD